MTRLQLPAAVMLVLAGCGTTTLSTVSKTGQATDPVWPDPRKATWAPTTPKAQNFTQVAPGLRKKALYYLIGQPHFREGMAGVREWDYVFNIPAKHGPVRCQFKIIFDDVMVAQSLYWRTLECAQTYTAWVTPPRQEERPVVRPFATLSADVLFAFRESKLSPNGQEALTDLLADVNRQMANSQPGQKVGISVAGHTDRIGGSAWNMTLSKQRAIAVTDYLVSKGVSPDLIRVEAHGKSQPVIDCPGAPSPAVVACLAPNRRVELSIHAIN